MASRTDESAVIGAYLVYIAIITAVQMLRIGPVLKTETTTLSKYF